MKRLNSILVCLLQNELNSNEKKSLKGGNDINNPGAGTPSNGGHITTGGSTIPPMIR